MWGELESESEESSEEEDDDGEDLGDQIDESGLVTPAEGLVTPSGLTSIPAGMETPDTIELRKKKIESEMEEYVFHSTIMTIPLALSTNQHLTISFPFSLPATRHRYCSRCCLRSEPIALVHR